MTDSTGFLVIISVSGNKSVMIYIYIKSYSINFGMLPLKNFFNTSVTKDEAIGGGFNL